MMSSIRRIVILTVFAAAVFAAVRGISAWLTERRKGGFCPVGQAGMLLNPLRPLIMPVRKTLERFGIESGHTVLELGPGPGYYSIDASRMVGPDGRLLCMDLQRGMLDILSSRLSEAGAGANLITADATHIPLADASVDRAFLVTVLGEVPDQDAALAELRRVLKSDGLLGFSESIGDPDIVFLGKLRTMCRRQGFEEVAHYGNPLGYTAVFRSSDAIPSGSSDIPSRSS